MESTLKSFYDDKMTRDLESSFNGEDLVCVNVQPSLAPTSLDKNDNPRLRRMPAEAYRKGKSNVRANEDDVASHSVPGGHENASPHQDAFPGLRSSFGDSGAEGNLKCNQSVTCDISDNRLSRFAPSRGKTSRVTTMSATRAALKGKGTSGEYHVPRSASASGTIGKPDPSIGDIHSGAEIEVATHDRTHSEGSWTENQDPVLPSSNAVDSRCSLSVIPPFWKYEDVSPTPEFRSVISPTVFISSSYATSEGSDSSFFQARIENAITDSESETLQSADVRSLEDAIEKNILKRKYAKMSSLGCSMLPKKDVSREEFSVRQRGGRNAVGTPDSLARLIKPTSIRLKKPSVTQYRGNSAARESK
ncbi:uncharacterized protein LOC135383245 [Ornithodoros turicata]|uniref:uncharacterized protein LOC135383245 n=1 Tax=Ornithodoros turicata TaxID=34597 RepID=UPI003139CEEE